MPELDPCCQSCGNYTKFPIVLCKECAAKAGGTQPTDAQQLKAAIALVRSAAMVHIKNTYRWNEFCIDLDIIGQRAAI
jgi:hypothetical protein